MNEELGVKLVGFGPSIEVAKLGEVVVDHDDRSCFGLLAIRNENVATLFVSFVILAVEPDASVVSFAGFFVVIEDEDPMTGDSRSVYERQRAFLDDCTSGDSISNQFDYEEANLASELWELEVLSESDV